jgi:hypothetical protein
MNAELLTARLAANLGLFDAFFHDLSEEQARFRPRAESWSLLEVINHLYDEEREDFRQRLDLILHHPGDEWPPIHPSLWVTERDYAGRDLRESIANFTAERRKSLLWLDTVKSADWTAVHPHPVFGSQRAGDLFASWVAHDFLHLRQVSRLYKEYYAHLAEPFSTAYAGD